MRKIVLLLALVAVCTSAFGGQLIYSDTGRPEITTLNDRRLNQGGLFVTFASLLRGQHGSIRVLDPNQGLVELQVDEGWGYFPATVVWQTEGVTLGYNEILLLPAGWKIQAYLTQHGCDQINARIRLLEEDRLLN